MKGVYGLLNFNNLRKFSWNIIYILMICIIIYLGFKYEEIFHRYIIFSFTSLNPFAYFIYQIFFLVIIGLLIRLPSFISILKKSGTWKIDWITFIPIIFPTFYITIAKIGYYTPLGFFFKIATTNYFNNFHMVIAIIFGYSLLSSFDKTN